MASSKDYRDYILEQLCTLDNIVCKPMMGEYLLYYDGTLFGGIYDDRLLIKMTKSNKEHNLPTELPYEGAKPMYLVDNVDDTEYLTALIKLTCEDIKNKKA